MHIISIFVQNLNVSFLNIKFMNYTFEHLFIPQIVNNSNKDDFYLYSVEIFDEFEFTEGCFGENFPKEKSHFDWKSFSICKEINQKLTYWLLRFPEPQKEPEAKWGLIIKKENKPYRYFTLELSENGHFVLCSNDGSTHKLHNTYEEDITVEKFIEDACAI